LNVVPVQVINPSVVNAAIFKLTISFDANNYTLPASEIEGLQTIYERYAATAQLGCVDEVGGLCADVSTTQSPCLVWCTHSAAAYSVNA